MIGNFNVVDFFHGRLQEWAFHVSSSGPNVCVALGPKVDPYIGLLTVKGRAPELLLQGDEG